jgi:predicted DNA-binding antitoxin AbrB/MazE fold protein
LNKRSGKKAFVWIMGLCLIFSTVGYASAASATDIKGHWAEGTITSWMNRDLAVGYGDGTFRPEVKVDRQEFTALVNRSFGFVEPGIIQYTDVAQNNWSYLDIARATKAGYVSGYPDGTFKPKKKMSRQEVAEVIVKLLGLKASTSVNLYTDVKSIPAWSKGAISAVKDHEIMAGYKDGTFRPLQSVTRAEAIVVLDRALKIKAEQGSVVPSPSSPPVTPPPVTPSPVSPSPVSPSQPTLGPAPVNLGTAGNFAILAKTGISSVPSSVVTGNIGVSPIDSTGITGFSLTVDATNEFSVSNQINGKAYASDYTSPTSSILSTAVSNMETAYTDAAGRAVNYTELHVGDLSGKTLTAGVYKWGTAVLINSDVTLHGGPNDVFIFQIARGITQANGTKIILTGGVQAKNIFWQTAETVSIGTGAHFEGIILSMTNITLGTNASINGRLLAQTAVTLDQSTVTAP